MLTSSPETSASLLACAECDLLQQEIALPPYSVALCDRCGAQLYRETPNGLDYTLAFTLCSVLFYALANTFPLVRLDLQGNTTTATLFGAVTALTSQDLASVASLVFVTTILVPGLEILAMLYILVPIKLGREVPGVPAVFRFIQTIRPWGMVEVFMVGILVSVVKLSTLANVIPGIALWSCGALMISFTAAAHFYNPRDVWRRLKLHD